MDRETMSNEENYCFDLAGYLHVPGVLVRGEVERLNKALDEAPRQLKIASVSSFCDMKVRTIMATPIPPMRRAMTPSAPRYWPIRLMERDKEDCMSS